MGQTRSVKGKKLSPSNLRKACLWLFSRNPKKRLNARQVVKKLQIKNSKKSVEAALRQMEIEGQLRFVKEGKYQYLHSAKQTTSSEKIYEGYVDLTKSGAAYIICEGLEKDVFVPARRTRMALHGDKVKVQVEGKYGRKIQGSIVEILEHTTNEFIGDFRFSKKYGLVIPDNRMVPFDIVVYPQDQNDAEDGDKVLVEVTTWVDDGRNNPIGRVRKVLDATDAHELMMETILIGQGFTMDFPSQVKSEAGKLSPTIDEAEIGRRRDFRSTTTFTIDPKTAKDFDDAISINELENGLVEVGVHIADVTHYVKPNSALDKEAQKRSTSVYLVDRVAPMLPEVLSNELCSLRPNEDSLTFSAVFVFDQNFNIRDRWFGKTVIHSKNRFSYEEAQDTLDRKEGEFYTALNLADKIARALRKKRFQEGSIAFESPEVIFELDEHNHPVSIQTKERLNTHMLIEDLMLLANREVAYFIARKEQQEIPFIYRVHDSPDPEKVAEYARLLHELGFEFNLNNTANIRESFNKLAEAARHDEALAFAEPYAVRTMAKAIYSTYNIGHWGLAFQYYAHFTSPIRRYADVLVHRVLEKNLDGTYRMKKHELEQICQHISNQERKAQEAERESIKYKMVEFISDHVGETFDGIVNGFIDFGFFVQLRESRVEGLVSFQTLDESFRMEDSGLVIAGSRSGIRLKIGDRIRVLVKDVRLNEMEVDLIWIQ